jgi:hypothetical protein
MTRLLHWLVFGVVLGAIPYATEVIVGWLDSPTGRWSFPPSTELVFLSIAALIVAFVEVASGLLAGVRGWLRTRVTFLVVIGGYVVCAAVFYGLFVQHAAHSPGTPAGVDCAMIARGEEAAPASRPSSRAQASAVRAALSAGWGADCAEWYAKQTRYFQRSQVAVIFSLVLGSVAVAAFRAEDRDPAPTRWR